MAHFTSAQRIRCTPFLQSKVNHQKVIQSILNNPDLEPIERHGAETIFRAFRKQAEELDFVASEVRAFQDSEFQSMAIVCRTQAETDALHQWLSPLGVVSLPSAPSSSPSAIGDNYGASPRP